MVTGNPWTLQLQRHNESMLNDSRCHGDADVPAMSNHAKQEDDTDPLRQTTC